MPDMDKVIKCLESCTGEQNDCAGHICPYWDFDGEVGCRMQMELDALELLKEQEAVKPIRDANCVRMFRCGACGEYVGFIDSDPGDPNEQDNYCRNCGRKVKWE